MGEAVIAMRQRVADKLRERGGVTILMALFAMLVASMVCIVILGAAVTSVKQAKAQQTQEQSTLALQSAAELVRAEITSGDAITFTGSKPENSSTVNYSYDGTNKATSISEVTKALTASALTIMSSETTCSFAMKSLLEENGASEYEQDVEVELVLRPAPDPDTKLLPKSIASAAQSAGPVPCQLIVTLSTKGPKNQEGEAQYLYLKYSQGICTINYYPEEKEGSIVTSPEKYTASFAWGNGYFYLAEDASTDA